MRCTVRTRSWTLEESLRLQIPIVACNSQRLQSGRLRVVLLHVQEWYNCRNIAQHGLYDYYRMRRVLIHTC